MAQAKVTDYYCNKRRRNTISSKRKAGSTHLNQDKSTLFQPDLPPKKLKLDSTVANGTVSGTISQEPDHAQKADICMRKVSQRSGRTRKQTKLNLTKGPLDEFLHTREKDNLEPKQEKQMNSNRPEPLAKAGEVEANAHQVTPQKTPTKRLSQSKADVPPCRKKAKENHVEEIAFTLDVDTEVSSVRSIANEKSAVRKSLQDVFQEHPQKVLPVGKVPSAVNKTQSGTSTVEPQKSKVSCSSQKLKKLSPTEVRAKLSRCGKLDELQAVLSKVHEQVAKTKRATAGKNKTSTQVVTEPEKKEISVPAYIKFRHLATPAPPSLTLPFKYRTLEDMFHSVDTVVSMLHNRSESCSFKKLKAAVQEMCRKTFQVQNLGQIKTVYPSSYLLYQQKKTQKAALATDSDKSDYELMIDANFDEDKDAVPETSNTGAMTAIMSAQKGQNILQKYTPSLLIARRTIFHNSLVDIVKFHHKKFLSSLNPPMSVPDNKLSRWHPKFNLDQIPEVEPAPIPQPPYIEKFSTAKDVLEKARTMMNPRVAKALELVQAHKKQQEPSTSKADVKPPAKESTLLKPANTASGLSTDLLARIREKEARRAEAAMMRSPEDEEKIGMLERLPDLCRILRGLFLTEKKAAITFEVASQKLSDSYRSALSSADVEKHINLMVEVLPEWVKIVHIRKDKYLKIDKKTEIKDLTSQINKALKELKSK